ncbi:hypothetical protein M124_2784 [Bacteroides fragilis str. 3988T(B)14]|uniref:Uncharacterized protein n=1 Tax=Bacteroides fragilis str. 3988T(B)14 TaxID=1339315 RepID=A0A015SMJ2_BACFG|nr:hypothetical protein M124_2784 [Bacteroides fragilis str. 3988T(B)14]
MIIIYFQNNRYICNVVNLKKQKIFCSFLIHYKIYFFKIN